MIARTILTGLLFGAVGLVVTVASHGMLRSYLGAGPARRSLDGLFAFLDVVLASGIGFVVGGLVVAVMSARAMPAWASLTAAPVAGLALALIVAPSVVVRPAFLAAFALGTLVAAGIVVALRLLRPAPGRQDG
jgi:hypothetical protein